MAIKSISIRIDEELLNQLHMVADYEGRSANSQILTLIRQCVAAYAGIIDFQNTTIPTMTRRGTGPVLEND